LGFITVKFPVGISEIEGDPVGVGGVVGGEYIIGVTVGVWLGAAVGVTVGVGVGGGAFTRIVTVSVNGTPV
jgi:hypothetical protein